MKKIARLLLTLSLVFCVLLALPLNASAASSATQDGLEVTITNDKTEYTADEDIQVSVNIKNNNSYKVEDVSIETLLPEGLVLKTGNLSATDVDIEAGASYSASVVAQLSENLKDNDETKPDDITKPDDTTKPDDITKPNDTTKPYDTTEPGGNDQETNFPQTGDNSNIVLWVVLLVASAVGIFLILKFKKTAKMMSLFLCFAMVLTMLPMSAFAAENDTATITVDKTITVNGIEYIIKSTVKYTVTTEDNVPEDEQVVPDEIAELFGVDPDEYDSDNDGLSNYVEIYMSGTDPTLVDTDEDGITDANEDADEDGLTNAEELLKGTDLTKSDSDGDGVSDYKEVNETNTDPCKYDTDEDGLSDGDELVLGLNPLEKKSDGVTLDSERKFTQTLNTENIDEQLTSEDNDAIPSLILTTSGNINNRVVITSTESNDFSDSRAVVGEPIDVSGDNLGEGIVSFALKNAVSTFSVEDTEATFNTNLICKYNEDGTTEYLDTTFNAEKNMVSATVTGEGTYFVLDVKNLFDELGLAMPTVSEINTLADPEPVATYSLRSVTAADEGNADNNGTSAVTTFAAPRATTNIEVASADTEKTITRASSGAMAQADIVFLIDTTGSMGDEIYNVKENVEYFVDALKEKGISAGLALIDYQDIEADGYDSTRVHKNGTSNWFYDMDAYKTAISALDLGNGGDIPECAVDALETGRLLDMRASAGKIFILVTDADYKVDNRYGIPSMAAEIELLKNAGVTCAVVSPSYEESTYYDLYNGTNGVWANIDGDFYTELMTLADKIGSDIVGDGYWIYLEGPVPVPVRLDEEPKVGSTVDTDKDGVYDIDELEGATPTGKINLDELITKVSKGAITGTDYGTVMMYKYKSNPVETDTDFDGTEDLEDNMPKSNNFKGIMHYELGDENKTCNVEFSMDYRDLIEGNNKVYSKDLSKLSILYASDVYDNLYVEFTSGATGGNDTPTTFGTILGLKDAKCYDIKSSDYSVDKDDVTEFFVGHKNIVYNGSVSEIIVVSVRGTNGTNAEWSSNFDVGADTTDYYDAVGYDHPDWKNKENHKGFDVAANRVYDKILEYINAYVDSGVQTSILITGHSRGAAVANILSQMFEDNTSYRTYGYTFATPNSTTASNASSYKNIFNIVNEDDIIPFLPLSEWNFKNYGITKSISVNEHYENKWLGAEEGTWEWLIGIDYNDDGGTSRTLECFGKIASCREDLYKLDTSKDGKVWENNIGHVTYGGAEKELKELKDTLEKEKLLKFCNVYIVGGGISYHVEVNYSPAYLMQSLSNMTTGTGPLLGHDVKGKYATAKASFVASSGKVVVGGMTHPHMQPTYYLIARNNFSSLD